MTTLINKINIPTKGFNDLIDITHSIQNFAINSDLKSGIISVYVSNSTSSIKVLENEPGIGIDLVKVLDEIVPINKIYQHDNLWHDGNAFSHLKAAIVGNNITLPFLDGKILMSNSQQIILIDFNNKPTENEIIVSIVG